MEFGNYLNYIKEDIDSEIEEYKDSLDSNLKPKFSSLIRQATVKYGKEMGFEKVKEVIGKLKDEETATNEKEVKFNIKLSNNIKVGDFDLTANFFADSLDWTRVKKETVNIHTTTDFSFDAEKGKLEFTMPDFNNTDITLQDSIEKIGKDIEEIIKKEMAELNKKIKSLGFKGEE
jgi:hypothetical protein